MDGLALARAAIAAGQDGRPVGVRLMVLCASGRIGEMTDAGTLFGAVLLKPVMLSRLRALSVLLEVPAPEPVRSAPVPEMEPAPEGPLAGRRVLLAEDNATNQIVTSAMLVRAGAQVRVVGDGESALAALAAGGFDAVLMDVQMPGLDGPTATRMLRAREEAGARIPVIGLTAAADEECVAECLDAGMDACLGKPITRDALIAALRMQFERV